MNRYEIRTCGIRRSGNHPIAYWLMAHFKAGIYYEFNLLPGQSPVTDGNMPFIVNNYSKTKVFNKHVYKDILYSYESIELPKVHGTLGSLVPNRVQALEESEKEFDILILRDPFNLAASWWKNRIDRKHKMKDILKGIKKVVLRRWKMYAAEVLGKTNYLEKKTVILFNKWFEDKAYRRGISEKLGLDFVDNGVDFVSGAGGGSSFDGVSYSGRGQEMSVLERWKNFVDILQFRDFFCDEELWEMSEKIFGKIPGTEILKG